MSHVLLLHGQPGNAQDWERVRAAIGDRARAIAIDRPGWNGGSSVRDLAGNAQAALDVLDAEGVERATVVGHSHGGAIAAWLAAQHPERVIALVLAAPSANCASLNRLDRMLAAPLVGPLLGAAILGGAGVALAAQPLRRRIGTQLGLDDRYMRGYAEMLLDPHTWAAFAFEQQMLVRDLPALENRLWAISAPTTIVVGTADRIVSPASARQLAEQIPAAKLVQLERAAHVLLQERPDELAEIIVAATRGE
jgi:pimeloyl-ACP methyl ester carboxylesterase